MTLVAAQGIFAQEAPAASEADISRKMLNQAQTLYSSGSYEECRTFVSGFLQEFETGKSRYTDRAAAAMYGLDALLIYTFREAEYEARIDEQLLKGLVLDLSLNLGDAAEIPPFILNRFTQVKTAYLEKFLRVTRRHGVGLFGALVLEPTVLTNPLLLQPGFAYTFNLTENLSLMADFRFPLQLPLYNSIRGQLGVIWYPSFSIEQIIATGVSFAYTFGLDNLTTYTHSISFSGRAEFLTRMGFGVVGSAELVRADLIVGGTATTPPSWSDIPFLGLLRIVFANITIYVFYVF